MISLIYIIAAWMIPKIGKWDNIETVPYHPSVHNLGNTGIGSMDLRLSVIFLKHSRSPLKNTSD